MARKRRPTKNLPNLARRKAKPCSGVDPVTDVRQPPLKRCTANVAKGARFCARHERERERQSALLAILPTNWATKLVGKRGRKAADERAPAAAQADKATAMLPSLTQQRSPTDAWPDPVKRPTPNPLTGCLPSPQAALETLLGKKG